jgi:hypothetical protein
MSAAAGVSKKRNSRRFVYSEKYCDTKDTLLILGNNYDS